MAEPAARLGLKLLLRPAYALGGLDVEIAMAEDLELSKLERLGLACVGVANVVAGMTVGLGAATVIYLAFDSILLALFVGFAALVFIVNLLRLVIAGGGPPRWDPYPVDWLPSRGPLIVLLLFALPFSQASMLAFFPGDEATLAAYRHDTVGMRRDLVLSQIAAERGRLQQQVDDGTERLAALTPKLTADLDVGERAKLQRRELVTRTRMALAKKQLAQIDRREKDAKEVELPAYEAHLAEANLMVRRLQLLWTRPWLALPMTLFLVLLTLGGPLLRYAMARRDWAILDYEHRRHGVDRALILGTHKALWDETEKELRAWQVRSGTRMEARPEWEEAPFSPKPLELSIEAVPVLPEQYRLRDRTLEGRYVSGEEFLDEVAAWRAPPWPVTPDPPEPVEKSRVLNPVTRFLWYSAGADPDILEHCPPSERAKYAGIGAIVTLTAMLAFFTGSYAFYAVFAPKDTTVLTAAWNPLAILMSGMAGVVWALVIYNLDRFVVSTGGKGDGMETLQLWEVGRAAPRLILAMMIGISLAKPLEVRILASEIEAELELEQHAYQAELDRRAEEASLERKTDLMLRIAEAERNEDPTGKLRWETRLVEADAALLVAKQKNAASAHSLDGLMKRIQLAEEISPLGSWLLTMLLLSVECAPVLFKLMITSGTYDYLEHDIVLLTTARHGVELDAVRAVGPDGREISLPRFHGYLVELEAAKKRLSA